MDGRAELAARIPPEISPLKPPVVGALRGQNGGAPVPGSPDAIAPSAAAPHGAASSEAPGNSPLKSPEMEPAPGHSPPTRPSGKARVLRQYELLERIKAYDPGVDEALVNRAYVFAVKAHGAQTRYSGDPYFAHPIQVAGILTDLRLDAASIVSGLLHDVLEDTDATEQDIRVQFGVDVARIVEGVTKLSQIPLVTEEEKQAENLRKFFMATSNDIRVLLVKLADRLHNMRTLEFNPKARSRARIARETLEIYAPLARMIGLYTIAGEMEDLGFATLNPAARETILGRIADMRARHKENVALLSAEVARKLEEAGVECEIFGREKKPYSIWRKLERKGISFEDLADVYAFRVLVNVPDDCYRALGIIHRAWRCIPERFHDFISVPKPNGYRSLHTTIVGAGNARVELQIRTREMEQVAEYGLAAHWRYKEKRYAGDDHAAETSGQDPVAGIASLIAILEDGGDAREFLENAKLQLYQGQVFAFTPKGRLIELPRGATPLDFAYHVHTDLGDRCARARVNGAERPLRTPLKNGDVVEILAATEPLIHADWPSLAMTGRARSAIKRLIRSNRTQQFDRTGRKLAEHAFHQFGRSIDDIAFADSLARLGFADESALFQAIGEGKLPAVDLVESVFPGLTQEMRREAARTRISGRRIGLYVVGEGLAPGGSLTLAPCCTPVPGDRIVGVMTPGQGLFIHSIGCHRLATAEEWSWIDLHWTPEAETDGLAIARVLVSAENSPGVLARLCAYTADAHGNIDNVRVTRRALDAFDILFDIEVTSARALTQILVAMRADRAILSADRLRGQFEPEDDPGSPPLRPILPPSNG